MGAQCCRTAMDEVGISDEYQDIAIAAGEKAGNALAEKGKEKATEAGKKIMDRVEQKFDDTVDRMITKKLLEKVDDTFDGPINSFIDKTFYGALNTIGGNYNEEMKQKQEEEEGAKELQELGLNKKLIKKMKDNGIIGISQWNGITKKELKELGFKKRDITKFRNKLKYKKDKTKICRSRKKIKRVKKLKTCGLTDELIDNMDDNGWLSETENKVNKWRTITENELKSMEFEENDIKLFQNILQIKKQKKKTKLLAKKPNKERIYKNVINAERFLNKLEFNELKINKFKKSKYWFKKGDLFDIYREWKKIQHDELETMGFNQDEIKRFEQELENETKIGNVGRLLILNGIKENKVKLMKQKGIILGNDDYDDEEDEDKANKWLLLSKNDLKKSMKFKQDEINIYTKCVQNVLNVEFKMNQLNDLKISLYHIAKIENIEENSWSSFSEEELNQIGLNEYHIKLFLDIIPKIEELQNELIDNKIIAELDDIGYLNENWNGNDEIYELHQQIKRILITSRNNYKIENIKRLIDNKTKETIATKCGFNCEHINGDDAYDITSWTKFDLLEIGLNEDQVEMFLNKIPKIEELQKWNIANKYIIKLEAEGYLDKDFNMELITNYQLKKLYFTPQQIKLFTTHMDKKIKQHQQETMLNKNISASKLLKTWGISQKQIDNMDLRGFLTKEDIIHYWHDNITHDHFELMQFTPNQIKLFKNGINNEIEKEKQLKHKNKRKSAIVRLKQLYIPQYLIERMDEFGWLDEENWNQIKERHLKNMGFQDGHIFLFMNGFKEKQELKEEINDDKQELFEDNKNKLTKQQLIEKARLKSDLDNAMKKTQFTTKLLLSWGIPKYLIENLKNNGWVDLECMDELLSEHYDDELEDLGFAPGHIANFKRKYQKWRLQQEQLFPQQQQQLFRKLNIPPKKQTLLKRNVTIRNNTKFIIQSKIISERKYDSFTSEQDAHSQQKSKEKQRNKRQESVLKNNKQTENESEQYTHVITGKEIGGNLNVNAGATPVTVGGGFNYKNTNDTETNNKQKNKTIQARENKQSSQNAKINKSSDGISTSTAAKSQHKWDKVNVGYTMIVPNAEIRFPVQISDANQVVYMTIKVPKINKTICENVPIDSNKIEVKQDEQNTNEDEKEEKNVEQELEKLKVFLSKMNMDQRYLEKFKQNGCMTMESLSLLDDDTLSVNIGVESKLLRKIFLKNRDRELVKIKDNQIKIQWKEMDDTINEDYKNEIDPKRMKYRKKEKLKYRTIPLPDEPYPDIDSDEYELYEIGNYLEIDGYDLLKKWELDQFYDRMKDEGWAHPLDWVNLNEFIMKENLGFRRGHVNIFNRKYNYWIKKYNEIRRMIPISPKGKDGVLIVDKFKFKWLKPGYRYVFTKLIIRKQARVSTNAWTPNEPFGGFLSIEVLNECVIEQGASITVSGKGFWGAKDPFKIGMCPCRTKGGGGSVIQYDCNKNTFYNAGGGGHDGAGEEGIQCNETRDRKNIGQANPKINDNDNDNNNDDTPDIGEAGCGYGNRYLYPLANITEHDFDEHYQIKYNKRPIRVYGSGGGCCAYKDKNNKKTIRLRGGAGGGALRLICNKLIMYEGAQITANGYEPQIKGNKSFKGSAGCGSGGSIYIKIKDNLEARNMANTDPKLCGDYTIKIQATGGISLTRFKKDAQKNINNIKVNNKIIKLNDAQKNINELKQEQEQELKENKDWLQGKMNKLKLYDEMRKIAFEKGIGIGAHGRIRIDYLYPGRLTKDLIIPAPYQGDGDETMNKSDNTQNVRIKIRKNRKTLTNNLLIYSDQKYHLKQDSKYNFQLQQNENKEEEEEKKEEPATGIDDRNDYGVASKPLIPK